MTYPVPTCLDDKVTNSFFSMDRKIQLLPKDDSIHKPMTIERVLQRKLRWLLLGGQYDWTSKIYPEEPPPAFPDDIRHLLKAWFPEIEPEAAIVNFYSPGDTLSVHRDVSEECDRGLISISLGCDGIFLIGNEDPNSHTIIRLRSGDAILMADESRFAWHALPKVLPDTCPEWLQKWPAQQDSNVYESWRGWMNTKRININIRQMKDRDSDV